MGGCPFPPTPKIPKGKNREEALAFVPVSNTCKVVMEFQDIDSFACNVYHVLGTSQMIHDVLLGIGQTFETWWKDNKALISDNITLNRVMVTDLHQENGVSVEIPVTTNNIGTHTGNPLPANVTLAVKWTTGFTGRSFRGRTYHIGLTDTMRTGNYVNSSDLALLQAYYAELMDTVTGLAYDVHLAVVSYRHNKVARAAGLPTVITGVSIEHTLDSQRRRLPGRGR